MRITVLTPTYNRGGSIQKLYTSLDNQSIKDFEWLIVDDGSLDDTAQVVRKVQKSADFRIRYIYKENGGKHTALNEGIKNIESDLTFIVDSDDWLKPNAIETCCDIMESFGIETDCVDTHFSEYFQMERSTVKSLNLMNGLLRT